MSRFDFPRVKQKDVIVGGEEAPELVLRKMLQRAKLAVTVTKEKKTHKKEDDLFHLESDDEPKVEAPSLLSMSCNLVEVLRLREELILSIHETDVLSTIYKR